MHQISYVALARTERELALRAPSGRSASTVFGGRDHQLRQTLMALRAGESLSEHKNPGEESLHVLAGQVLLRSGETAWNGSVDDLMTIPDGLHSVDAREVGVILLTVVKRR